MLKCVSLGRSFLDLNEHKLFQLERINWDIVVKVKIYIVINRD